MSFLRLDGAEIPVKPKSVRVEQLEIGGRERAIDGSTLYGVRNTRRRISFTTCPIIHQEADFWRQRCGPSGLVCSWMTGGTDYYSDDGRPGTATGTELSDTIPSEPSFDGTHAVLFDGSDTLVYPVHLGDAPFLLSWWESLDTGTTWTIWAQHWEQEEVVGTYSDGMLQAGSPDRAVATSYDGDNVTLTSDHGGLVANLCVLPGFAPGYLPDYVSKAGGLIAERSTQWIGEGYLARLQWRIPYAHGQLIDDIFGGGGYYELEVGRGTALKLADTEYTGGVYEEVEMTLTEIP